MKSIIVFCALLTACSAQGPTYSRDDPNRCGMDEYPVCDMHMGKPVVCVCQSAGADPVGEFHIE